MKQTAWKIAALFNIYIGIFYIRFELSFSKLIRSIAFFCRFFADTFHRYLTVVQERFFAFFNQAFQNAFVQIRLQFFFRTVRKGNLGDRRLYFKIIKFVFFTFLRNTYRTYVWYSPPISRSLFTFIREWFFFLNFMDAIDAWIHWTLETARPLKIQFCNIIVFVLLAESDLIYFWIHKFTAVNH